MSISMYNDTNALGLANSRLGWRQSGANWNSTLTLEIPQDTSLEMQGRSKLPSPILLRMPSSTLPMGLSQ